MRNLLNYIDFIVFVLILFIKAWIFCCTIDSSLTTAIANHELYILRLSINYLASCLLIASLAYLIRSKGWRLLILLLTDIWLIANLIYFRSYKDLLNSWCLLSISNLSGFETAIWTFLEWSDLTFLALSLLYGVCTFLLRNHSGYKTLYTTLTCLLLGLGLNIPQMIVSDKDEYPINPYDSFYHDMWFGRDWYCITFSPYKHFMNELFALRFSESTSSHIIDDDMLRQLVHPSNSDSETIPAPYNVVIVFFESLEDWTLNLMVEDEEITPNLNKLSQHPSAHHLEVVPQVAQGMSSDAQFIVLAGLLPIKNGAASMRFPLNTYYTLPKSCQFEQIQMFVPTPPNYWNQKILCQTFGFNELYATSCNDQVLFDTLCNAASDVLQPAFFMGLSLASHSPFTKYADYSKLQLTNVKDTELRNYLRCVNYTDACLGKLINQILDTPLSENTILLIMGDHTIFYPEKRVRFFRELSHNGDPQFPKIPALLYTPLESTILPEDTIYQMDIYPTILSLLNKQYLWQGVGKNLWENTPRKMSVDSAALISNSIIQQNYFQQFSSQ